MRIWARDDSSAGSWCRGSAQNPASDVSSRACSRCSCLGRLELREASSPRPRRHRVRSHRRPAPRRCWGDAGWPGRSKPGGPRDHQSLPRFRRTAHGWARRDHSSTYLRARSRPAGPRGVRSFRRCARPGPPSWVSRAPARSPAASRQAQPRLVRHHAVGPFPPWSREIVCEQLGHGARSVGGGGAPRT